jgi:1,2-phenylacetyl-CoA epoxidase catalytic subunit
LEKYRLTINDTRQARARWRDDIIDTLQQHSLTINDTRQAREMTL